MRYAVSPWARLVTSPLMVVPDQLMTADISRDHQWQLVIDRARSAGRSATLAIYNVASTPPRPTRMDKLTERSWIGCRFPKVTIAPTPGAESSTDPSGWSAVHQAALGRRIPRTLPRRTHAQTSNHADRPIWSISLSRDLCGLRSGVCCCRCVSCAHWKHELI
jgi:hypothetical protein